MSTTLKNALIRAIRTFLMAAVPVYIAGIAGAVDFSGLGDTRLLATAAIAGIIAALSFIVNVLEGTVGVTYNKG